MSGILLIIFKLKHNNHNMRLLFLLLLTLNLHLSTAREPHFIDFTYTQLLEETNYAGTYQDKINITPDTQQLEEYQFPEVC